MKGEVVFDHVSFGYTPRAHSIHDFSVCGSCRSEEFAIVGPTGAGEGSHCQSLMRIL